MQQRLLSVLVPEIAEARAREVLAEARPLATWSEVARDQSVLLHALIDASDADRAVGRIEHQLADLEALRMVLLPVEASIPHPTRAESEEARGTSEPKDRSPPMLVEELYDDVVAGMDASPTFLATVVLSAIVACIGVARDDVAIIIGAMVIAPLLKPNMAMCLGTTLGDLHLLRHALWVNAVGLLLGLLTAAPFGVLGGLDTTLDAVAGRTHIGFMDLLLASAAGAAGALALTSGTISGIVGVMIAVALIPVLAVLGMAVGAGMWQVALGAGLLLLANVICINLAGVVVFVIRRIRPRVAWQQDKARRAVWIAVGLWSFLLVGLAAVLLLATDLRR